MLPRFVPGAVFALAAVLLPIASNAQQPDSAAARDSLARQVQRLQRAVDSLRAAGERTTQRLIELDERGAPASPAATSDSARRTLASSRGIYGKPFVRRFGAGTAVGGYADIEYRHDLTAKQGAFDAHRLVPFIFSEITDRLHFGTEIEFEHGPTLEIEDGAAEGNGEINVEFATLDYRIHEALNVRGGIILSPLGRFNLVHDSPVNDLTDRPLVDEEVIPTTLSEAGMGLFGTLYPSERSLLSYEAYAVNGFTGALIEDAATDGTIAVREGRGLRGGVSDAPLDFVGRVAFSPFLGLELGASAHLGQYALPESVDPLDRGDEHTLRIHAYDATFTRGPLELQGEYASLEAKIPLTLRALGVASRREGYYAQANWHFGHGLVAPKASSVFTGVVRWDDVDEARDAKGGEVKRLTLGLNWRPVEDAVLKTDLLWSWTTPPGATTSGDAAKGFRVSMATYF